MANKPAEKTVSYYAISILNSKTFWFNAASFIAALSQTVEFTRVIPASVVPFWLAITAMINVWLRTQSVRPVAMIRSGDTQEIRVPKLSPPAPPAMTD